MRRRKATQARWTGDQYLEDALAQLEQLAADAAERNNHGAAVAAKREAVEMRRRLDESRAEQRAAADPPSPAEYRAALLRQVRRMRIGASEAKSYVAATRLVQLEAALVGEIEERAAAAEGERLRQADGDALVREFAEAIAALPSSTRKQIVAAVGQLVH